jgi:hypothetical protein
MSKVYKSCSLLCKLKCDQNRGMQEKRSYTTFDEIDHQQVCAQAYLHLVMSPNILIRSNHHVHELACQSAVISLENDQSIRR